MAFKDHRSAVPDATRGTVTPDDVLAALGGSIFAAELRGNFATARALSDQLHRVRIPARLVIATCTTTTREYDA